MVTTSQSRLDCDAVVKADQAARLSSAVFVSELYGALGCMITPSSVFPFQQQDRFQRRADNVEGRVCVPPTFTLARTKLPCNICGEALRCRLSTKQMTSHLRDSHISLRSDPTFGPTDGLEYGSLRWFRIALAWRRPCQGLVCLDPPTTRAIDTSKYNVPLMFLLSINLIDLARERAYPVLLKAMETLSLHHKAVALKHWLKLYIEYNSDLTKSTVAQYIRLLQGKWRSKKELGMRMKHNFIYLTTRERKKLTNYIDAVEVKASQLKAFIVFGTKRRLVPNSRLLALVVNLQRTFRSRMATSYHIRSCIDHHVGSSATIELQRITRGVRARNRSKRRQQINYHHITRTRYETTQSSAFYNFERQGAAKTIQAWFKTRSQDANCTWSIRESRKTQLVRTLQPAIRQKRPSNTIQLDGRNERRLQINAMTKRTALIFIRHNLRKWRRRHQKDKQVKATSKHRLAHTDTIRSKLDCIARTNPKGERNMAHGIIALQSVHRRSVARAKVAMIKNKRVTHTQRFLQMWLKGQAWRKYKHRKALVLWWLVMIDFSHLRTQMRCAAYIAASWRRYQMLTFYSTKRRAMLNIASKVTSAVRLYFSQKRVVSFAATLCQRAEHDVSGRAAFKNTRVLIIQHQIVKQSSLNVSNYPAEMQKIFQKYCTCGKKENKSQLGIGNFLRLMKDSPNLICLKNKNSPSQSDVELTFMKHRRKNGKPNDTTYLNYSQFLDSVRSLARAYFDSVPDYKHFSCTDAKLCAILQNHIFQSLTATHFTVALRANSCAGRATNLLELSARLVAALWHRIKVRVGARTRIRFDLARLRHLRGHKATLSLQCLWRGASGRLVAARIAQDIYEKCVEFASGRVFWFNRVTGASFWAKPPALAWLEAGNSILMPDADLLFDVKCAQCNNLAARVYCLECGDLYCEICQERKHNYHHTHTMVEVVSCMQCRFQVPHCDLCGELAARKESGLAHMKLCMRCISGCNTLKSDAYRVIPYIPNMARHHQHEENRKLSLQMHVANHEFAAGSDARNTPCRVLKIQKVWRGYHSRGVIARFHNNRGSRLSQRRKVAGLIHLSMIRSLGRNRLLKYDTSQETVIKKVPFWARDTVVDIVRGRWVDFAKLVKNQSHYVKLSGVPGVTSTLAFVLTGWRLTLKKLHALSQLTNTKYKYEKLQAAYWRSRSDNDSKGKQEQLKMNLRRCRKKYERMLQVVAFWDKQKMNIKAQYSTLLGPRKMETMVQNAISRGMEIEHFTMALRQGSQFAEQSNADAELIKDGDRFRLGNSPVVYWADHGNRKKISPFLYARRMMTKKIRRNLARDRTSLSQQSTHSRHSKLSCKIKMQRIWTHDDIANLKVYKLPKQAPSFRSASLARDVRSCLTPLPRSLTLKISGEYLRGNVLGQFILKAEVNALVAYRHQWVCFAHRVDAGSRMQKFLMGRSLRMEEKISKRKHGIYVKLDAKPAGSFTSEIYNSLESSLRKAKNLSMLWEKAPSKVPVAITIQGGSGRLENLGTLQVDMDCPVYIARNILMQALGSKLNDGTGFKFLSQGKAVSTQDEKKRKLVDVAHQHLSPVTRELENALTIAVSGPGT